MSVQTRKGDAVQVTSGATPIYLCAEMVRPNQQEAYLGHRLQRLGRYVSMLRANRDEVDQDKWGEIEIFNWSPDSQWIAGDDRKKSPCPVRTAAFCRVLPL